MNQYNSTKLSPRIKNLTGNKYDRLTVIGYAGRLTVNGKHRYYWRCLCSCGQELDMRADALKTPVKGEKSCGCYAREVASQKCLNRFIDITGNRYDRLVVIEYIGNVNDNRQHWLCQCDCGKNITARGDSLKAGTTKSCGCLLKDIARERMVQLSTTHGMSKTSIYSVWISMRDRCKNPNNSVYKNYGGRGITVCQEWDESFEAFHRDVGDPPTSKHTIDRINNDGNYEPGNVRWVTMKKQARNRRSNFLITYDGKTMTSIEWGELLGIRAATIRQRIKRDGWSIEKALTTPVR